MKLVYERSWGKKHPQVGRPEDVKPGDLLTFFKDGASHTRVVASVKGRTVRTEANGSGLPPLTVKFMDFSKIQRKVVDKKTKSR